MPSQATLEDKMFHIYCHMQSTNMNMDQAYNSRLSAEKVRF
jgi:hypothetical protein